MKTITSKSSRRAIALEREEKLCLYEELSAHGADGSLLFKTLKISPATYYRWKRAYGGRGLVGLMPKSTRPHKLRHKEVLTPHMITKIKDLRNQNPLYGRIKIHALLLRQGICISESSVNRALQHLMRRNLVTPVVVLKCAKERKLLRKFEGHSQKLPRNYRAQIQVDHTIVNLHGKEIKQFNAIEKHSRFSIAKTYENADSLNAADFLNKILKELPIPIEDIQVDGGPEFRDKFEAACKNKKLPLFVLPPRSPKINGKVERLNQTWKDEFYLQNYNDLPTKLDELNKKIEEWQKYYNENRIHRSLKDKNNHLLTPYEFIYLYHIS
jgi:transposase/transposase-like protein